MMEILSFHFFFVSGSCCCQIFPDMRVVVFYVLPPLMAAQLHF